MLPDKKLELDRHDKAIRAIPAYWEAQIRIGLPRDICLEAMRQELAYEEELHKRMLSWWPLPK